MIKSKSIERIRILANFCSFCHFEPPSPWRPAAGNELQARHAKVVGRAGGCHIDRADHLSRVSPSRPAERWKVAGGTSSDLRPRSDSCPAGRLGCRPKSAPARRLGRAWPHGVSADFRPPGGATKWRQLSVRFPPSPLTSGRRSKSASTKARTTGNLHTQSALVEAEIGPGPGPPGAISRPSIAGGGRARRGPYLADGRAIVMADCNYLRAPLAAGPICGRRPATSGATQTTLSGPGADFCR